MPGRRARRTLARCSAAVCLAAVLLAACGEARLAVPDPAQPARPAGLRSVSLDGVRLTVPANWVLTEETGALGAVDTSGPAVIALWRHARSGAAPAGAAALHAALASLVSVVRRRDPGIRILRTSVGRFAGSVAVGIDAIERIRGQTRRVRSVHLLRAGSELVLEEYAPVAAFPAVDRSVFSPVLDALRASTPAAP